MKFTEACVLINNGKKIRRRCWGNGDFFIVDNFTVLESDDFAANDWEEFVKEKEGDEK